MPSPRVEYDPQADAAYIYLIDEMPGGGVDRTIPPLIGMIASADSGRSG